MDRQQSEATISECERSISRLQEQMGNPATNRDTKQYIRETIASFRRDIANARVELWNLDQAEQARREAIGRDRYHQDTIEPVTPTSGAGYNDSLRHRDLTA